MPEQPHPLPSLSLLWLWVEPCCWVIPCVEVLLFSASELAVESLLWVTFPESPPPQQLLPLVETGALVFDCTPGAEVASELAF